MSLVTILLIFIKKNDIIFIESKKGNNKNMPKTTLFIMHGDDYLMHEGDTVIFDTRADAEECYEFLEDPEAKIVEAILFCDHKINWKDIRNQFIVDEEVAE